MVVGDGDERRRVAADVLDAGPVGGAPLGSGNAATARADDPGGDRAASRCRRCQRLPVACRPRGAGPARAARPTANRAAAAARRPSLVAARPAAGPGWRGRGGWERGPGPEAQT